VKSSDSQDLIIRPQGLKIMPNLSIHQRQIQMMQALRDANATRQQGEAKAHTRFSSDEAINIKNRNSRLETLDLKLEKKVKSAYRWTRKDMEKLGLWSLMPKTFSDVVPRKPTANTSDDKPAACFEETIVTVSTLEQKISQISSKLRNIQQRRAMIRNVAVVVSLIVIVLLFWFLAYGL